MNRRIRLLVTLGLTMVMSVVSAVPAGAGNATGLQWGDGSTPFSPSLTLVDQTSSGVWTGVVETVRVSWDNETGAPDVLTLSRTTSTTTTENSGSLCSTDWNANLENVVADEIHVCNFDFDDTGWVGLSITWSVPSTGQIIVAQTLLNDFFLVDGDPTVWANANARQHVACQEIGHGFGLDHQRGRFKQTCMNDRFGITSGDFTGPNQHDFDQLEEIYFGGGGGGGGGGGNGNCPANSKAPHCQPEQRDFGTLIRIVHVIPPLASGS